MPAPGHHRWPVVTAIGLTLLAFLASARLQIPIQTDVRDQLVPDSLARFAWGPPVTLAPGRYRARATIRGNANGAADPSHAGGMIGFRPIGSPWGREAWLLRGTEFARRGKRTIEFTIETREPRAHAWVWRAEPASFQLLETGVFREEPLWPTGSGVRGSGRTSLAGLTLMAAALLLGAGAMGNRAPVGRPVGGVGYTLVGLLVYLLAGVCLLSSAQAIIAGSGAHLSRWVFFPGMSPFPGSWPPWLAAAIALTTAWAIGLSTGRARVLLWALPLAALGLWFGGQLAGPRSDFQIYYSAGLSLWSGVNPYALRPERVLNPPSFVLATGLFPLLPLAWSGFLWFGLKAAAAVWCLRLSAPALLGSAPTPNRRWFLRPEWIALGISGRYVLMDLQYGNTNVLVLLSLLALAAAWRIGNRPAAGVASAIGTAIKVTPALSVVTAAFAGRIRWAVGTAVLSGALLAISAGFLEWRAEGAGMGFWRDVVAETGSVDMGRADNQSLRGLTLRTVAGVPIRASTVSSIPNLGLDPSAARIVEGILVAAVLWMLFLLGRAATRGGEEQPGRWAGLWAGTALGMLLISPGTWSVHYALIFLPVVVLVDRAQHGHRGAAVISLLLAIVIILPMFSRLANDWFMALSLLPILSFGALWVLVRSEPRGRSKIPAMRSLPCR